MRIFFIILALTLSSLAPALEVIVDVRNTFFREQGDKRHFAKLTISNDRAHAVSLTSCSKDGSPLPEGEEPIVFPSPLMTSEVALRVFRLFNEPELAWAIPNSDKGWGIFGEDNKKGNEVVRAWFYQDSEHGGRRLTLSFDNQWKKLEAIHPIGFEQRTGFRVNVVSGEKDIEGVLQFTQDKFFISSSDHNLLGQKPILPFDEVAADNAIRQSSRLFLAVITVTGENDSRPLIYKIPLREVLEPKDGKVFVAVETELNKLFGQLLRSGDHVDPAPDLSHVPPEFHQQAREAYQAFLASGRSSGNPVPKGKILIHALKETDLSAVDEKRYHEAVKAFALVGGLIKSGSYTGYAEGHEFCLDSTGPDGDILTLPVKAYTAGHFLIGNAYKTMEFRFTDFIRLGMIHSDRLMDCVRELEKQGVIKLAE